MPHGSGCLGSAPRPGLTYLARQIPISRPSPWYRMWWLLNCVIGTQRRAAARGKRDPWLSPPKAVIDNLIFTRGGVYAEFVMAGQPGGIIPYEVKRIVAKSHRPLVRQLPSGMVFWGMSPRIDPMRMMQRLLGGLRAPPGLGARSPRMGYSTLTTPLTMSRFSGCASRSTPAWQVAAVPVPSPRPPRW